LNSLLEGKLRQQASIRAQGRILSQCLYLCGRTKTLAFCDMVWPILARQ